MWFCGDVFGACFLGAWRGTAGAGAAVLSISAMRDDMFVFCFFALLCALFFIINNYKRL